MKVAKETLWVVDEVDVSKSALFVNGMQLEVNAESFSYIIGIKDRGFFVDLTSDIANLVGYIDKYDMTS